MLHWVRVFMCQRVSVCVCVFAVRGTNTRIWTSNEFDDENKRRSFCAFMYWMVRRRTISNVFWLSHSLAFSVVLSSHTISSPSSSALFNFSKFTRNGQQSGNVHRTAIRGLSSECLWNNHNNNTKSNSTNVGMKFNFAIIIYLLFDVHRTVRTLRGKRF